MTPRIYINGRFLTHPLTGVQRYSRELLKHFDLLIERDANPPDVELICLTPPADIPHPGWKHIAVKPVGFNHGSLWEQFDLPFFLRGNLLFSPANIGPWNYSNQVVTFHDASIFAIPEAYSAVFRAKYGFVFRQLVRRARQVLTDSKFSQGELARYLKVDPGKFNVIYPGSGHLNDLQADHRIHQKYQLENKPYLLIVSSISRHKNYPRIIEAIKRICFEIDVVIVGGNYKKVFNDFDLSSLPRNFHWLGSVNDNELKSLYEKAVGLIFPSVYEGFGFPPLEAMQSGCPVLCANAASLPEVAGEAAIYFSPYDVDQIAETIEQFLANVELQASLREKGFARCAEFDWLKTAQSTFEVLLDLCK